MSPIAGQTTEPNGLNFFVETQGFPGAKKSNFFSKFFFHGQRRALQLVLFKTHKVFVKGYHHFIKAAAYFCLTFVRF